MSELIFWALFAVGAIAMYFVSERVYNWMHFRHLSPREKRWLAIGERARDSVEVERRVAAMLEQEDVDLEELRSRAAVDYDAALAFRERVLGELAELSRSGLGRPVVAAAQAPRRRRLEADLAWAEATVARIEP